MGVTQKTAIKIECDNPNCPGNDLDPKSYDNWIRVTATTQHSTAATKDMPSFPMPITMGEQFFCSASCAGSINEVLTAAEEARSNEIENQLPDEEA